jgi:hypothetical protein
LQLLAQRERIRVRRDIEADEDIVALDLDVAEDAMADDVGFEGRLASASLTCASVIMASVPA